MKLFFKFLSLIFHPWLILSYCVVLLWLVNPYVFQGSSYNVGLLMIKIWISSFLFPLLIAGVMIGLRFIDLTEKNQSRERIFPLIGTMLFYIWLSVNMYKAGGTPESLLTATMGATFALILGFVFNLIFPISFHSLGMGVLLGNATLIYFYFGFLDFSLPGQQLIIGSEWIVIICLWLAGWILTARIWLKDYSLHRIYGSLTLGFVSQWLALVQLQFLL